jgi:hypothetical protein
MLMIEESRTENLEIIEENPGSISVKNIITFSLKYDKPDFINSREIRYNNEMFDIVYKKDVKGDVILYCVNDKKETRLHTVFRSLNEPNDNPASVPDHLAVTILKNLLKNYLPNPEDNLVEIFASIQFHLYGNLSVPLVIPEKIYPPPQSKIINS